MASLLSTSVAASPTPLLRKTTIVQCTQLPSFSMISGGQRFVTLKARKRASPLSHCFKTTITCSVAQPETLKIVQATIASQLSIDESTVAPATKFADLGADSLDTVEIMMALEETFGVSIGESGAENIATVQDAADLIEKVKAEA
uniref:acyl carrier protein-like n=1 Tax=Erigeron canadensis TaxID=72917 RepID=UPI001CB914DE|nr:acyl carrier protein-like [Erigeron canadensis]